MKNRNFSKLVVGLSLGALPFAGACWQQTATPPPLQSAALTASAEPAVYTAQTPAPDGPAAESATAEAPAADAPSLDQLAEAPVQLISTNQPVPAKIRLSAPAAELVKLANSGVEQGVMLAYVTNSPGVFNLTAEEIIYLNDVGVPSPVVTAMIQRDQALKAAGAATLTAQAPPVTALPAPGAPAPYGAQPPADMAPTQVTPPLTPPADYPIEPPPAPAEEVTDSTFYEPLAPYGSWVYVSGYGRCWRPTVVAINPGWQPYFDNGHWVYSDCGWYWMSDYSWGWAPFHYGRWFRHSGWGWCWAPDTVWAPSWVSWRHSSDYCGWAPLPPGAYFSFSIGLTFHGRHVNDWDECGLGPSHYRFVAWRNFDNHRLHDYALPPRQVTQVYHNTVVVNRITINNNTVINQGIPRERVVAATHHDLKPVAIRETTTTARGVAVGGRAERLSGNTLTVYRPPMPQPNRTATGTPSGGQSKPLTIAPGMRTPPTTTRGQGPATVNNNPIGARNPAPATAPAPRPSTPSRQVLQTPAPGQNNQGPGNSTVARPGFPATPPANPGQNSRAGLAANQPSQQVPTTARPNPAPPAWRNADPNARFERIQPPVRQAEAPRQYNAPNTYQPPARTAPEVPRYAPAPNYNPQQRPQSYNQPQRSIESPRYSATPSYTAPQRSYSPPPTYSRPESAPSRQAPSYSEAPRYSAPAAPAQRAPTTDSRPAPSTSKGDNNNGGSRRQ